MVQFKKIDKHSKELEKTRQLYLKAFPKEERAPFYVLLEGAGRKEIDFVSAWEQEDFLGFIYALKNEELSYLFYYAVEEGFRNQGRGSRILQAYQGLCSRLILAIEPVEEKAPNYEERKNRLAFYQKNGFESMGFFVREMGVTLEMLGPKGESVSKTEYDALLKSFLRDYSGSEEVLSVQQIREADAYTIRTETSGRELMQRAGEAVFYAADWEREKNIAIVCGKGNNAGDGYVLGGYLQQEGYAVKLFLLGEDFSPDGKYYFEQCKSLGVPYEILGKEGDQEEFLKKLEDCGYIVDCIYGTGFLGEVREPAASVIKRINASPAYVVSVDINSGMEGDTGEAALCVRSDLTVSIGFWKKGLRTPAAKKWIKRAVNRSIGLKRP